MNNVGPAMPNLNECVDCGAKLLDEKHPDWFKKIDINTLCMDHCSKCVLGQVFGDYIVGLSKLWKTFKIDVLEHNGSLSSTHGFDIDSWKMRDVMWDELRQLWIKVIQERLDNCTKKPYSEASKPIFEHVYDSCYV